MLIFDETFTCASNDLERATAITRRMVTEFGMPDDPGPVRYVGPAGSGCLGAQTAALDLSADTKIGIDNDVRAVIDDVHDVALKT